MTAQEQVRLGVASAHMSDVNRFKQVFVKYKVKPPPPKVNAKKRKWQQKQQKQQKQQLEKDGLSGTSPPKGRQPSASPPKRIVVEDDFSDVVDLVAYEKEADHGLKSGKNSLQNIQSIIPIDMPPELGILHQTDDSKKSGCRDTKKSTETSRAKPNKKRRAYRFAHVPGFVIITNALTLKEQLQWSYRCLTEYADAKHTNLTNIKVRKSLCFAWLYSINVFLYVRLLDIIVLECRHGGMVNCVLPSETHIE